MPAVETTTGMKKINLPNGQFVKVDDQDYGWLNQWSWHLRKGRNTFYAIRGVYGKRRKVIVMHREILGLKDSKVFVDHKDGDGLNNRRSNLRIASNSQSMMNRTASKSSNSKFKGVDYVERDKKYRVRIAANGKLFNVGYFTSEEEAAMAYNKKASEIHGEFAKLNMINATN